MASGRQLQLVSMKNGTLFLVCTHLVSLCLISLRVKSDVDDFDDECFENRDRDDDDSQRSRQVRNIEISAFTSPTGPKLTLPSDPKPVDFFFQLIPEEFFEYVADETNRFAHQKQQEKPDSVWELICSQEMKAFVSVNLVMGLHSLPSIQDFWSEDDRLLVSGVAKVMSETIQVTDIVLAPLQQQ